MILPSFNLHQPATLSEALELSADLGPSAHFLAGGSDLLVRIKLHATPVTDLISIGAVKELQRIEGLEIGGGVSLQSLVSNPAIKKRFPALSQAVESVGTAQVRNMGTLAGNICQETRCWYFNRSQRLARLKPICIKRGGAECLVSPKTKRCFATYQGDTAAALIALGAEVRLQSKGQSRQIGLTDLFRDVGDHHLNLMPGELLTHVILPDPSPASLSGYSKFRLRAGIDFPLAGVALNLIPPGTEKPEGEVRVGLTGLASFPQLLVFDAGVSPVELGDAVRRIARPVNNVGGQSGHRRHMAGQLAEDLIKELRDEASNHA